MIGCYLSTLIEYSNSSSNEDISIFEIFATDVEAYYEEQSNLHKLSRKRTKTKHQYKHYETD